ncbi:MAG: hypothetical protein ACLUEU_01210 [Oscillospiraceae bacterium]
MELLNPLVNLSGTAVLNVYDGAAIRDTLAVNGAGGVQVSGQSRIQYARRF